MPKACFFCTEKCIALNFLNNLLYFTINSRIEKIEGDFKDGKSTEVSC